MPEKIPGHSNLRTIIVILSVFVVTHTADAQLCQGSLGDPVINITFGAGANPGAPLNAATTNYRYVSNDCPDDGFYTVRNNTSSCFGSSWFNLTKDHTGDPNGYFMLVNASYDPGAFYVDTVKDLCSNTTFEFACWIMNVQLPVSCSPGQIKPNLTFSIENTDGTVLQTYQTGDIPSEQSATWRQHGFFFNTPPGVNAVVVRLVNNAPGGCGNDIALDDITFRPCGPLLTSTIAGKTTSADTICNNIGENYTFNCSVSAGFSNPSYQWQQSTNGIDWTDLPGENNLTLTKNFPQGSSPGVYSYRLSVAEAGNLASPKCRIASAPLSVTVAAMPVITVTSNSPVCLGDVFRVFFSTGGTNCFSIATGPNSLLEGSCDGQFGSDAVSYQDAGVWNIKVTNSFGCSSSSPVQLQVLDKPTASVSFTEAAVCEGSNVQLQASGGIRYEWQPSSVLTSSSIPDPVANPVETTTFTAKVYNQVGCSDTADIKINVAHKPSANAGPDKVIIANSAAQLQGTVGGDEITYSWAPAINIDDATSLTPNVTPLSDANYILTAVSTAGCGTASDNVHIRVFKDLYVPNAFTPNNDGKNDTWNIPALAAFQNYTVSVFNRSGQLVYYAEDNFIPWDGYYKGSLQSPGTYTYMIDLKQNIPLFKGALVLLR